MAISDAQRRVLLKAKNNGRVHCSGGFTGVAQSAHLLDTPDFDRQCVIDRCIVAGLLRPGEGFNSYVLTDKGVSACSRMRERPEAQA